MAGRISLLMLTAGAAGAALIGNAMGLAAAEPAAPAGGAPSAPRSRLGVAIADDLGERDKAAVRRARALELREQAVRAANAIARLPSARRPRSPN
ncbi:hypothetical protein [Sphingomonas sp. CFBP 13720]|uniref:hypothetical protein n=1 Tax=Sphingomonas sp. CFBP 13720 TaxID=2775302 RepID=UPI00177FE910|nr:hypothetical protein [Sphingomonas sp. CFBP 13720]MBD8678436.1 hypothetical protein [Sphingomonas sp. CFBP 13720]